MQLDIFDILNAAPKEWHLVKGEDGRLICKFVVKDTAFEYLEKQVPNGWFADCWIKEVVKES